jgi:molybdopterin molybdotransferase
MSGVRIETDPSCADARDPTALGVTEARRRILEAVGTLPGHERLAVRSALGRVLHEAVVPDMDVPSHTNSAVDGYAVRGADLPDTGSKSFRLIGTALAGARYRGEVGDDECVRIMTGAAMPPGTDTVIMQEQVELGSDRVLIDARHHPGQNVRLAGEDMHRGEVVLEAGHRLTPADLGLLASLGRGEVNVRQLPRVSFFSTGDELRSLGEVLAPGEVYDSNRYTLFGMLSRVGVSVQDLGVVKDDPATLRAALQGAAAAGDLVITSGGVSVGDADFVKTILTELGEMAFWKIAMKPGRPLVFGRIGAATFFGLPGNPVAVMVTFYQFVLPALHRLMGLRRTEPLMLPAVSLEPLRKRAGRTEFLRGVLETDADGRLTVRRTGQQGSGILRSMSLANCFIVLPEENAGVASGDVVPTQPFCDFI